MLSFRINILFGFARWLIYLLLIVVATHVEQSLEAENVIAHNIVDWLL